jgi:hypothetical protein
VLDWNYIDQQIFFGAPMKIIEAVHVLRSKNAGPLTLTIDLLFKEREIYDRALASPTLNAVALAKLYRVSANAIEVIPYPVAQAIKVVLPRRIVAGSPGDSDVYGAQQHALLLELEI